ncbi:MAG: DUF2752 domain-containing protein [Planctomycetes bacterium]|nr:DUF2752 domain-containing protein [Planctomycetota bacterium]NOG54698.1 DUF2752 domain-containing protein [Planctomycetota bacterium]
MNADQRRPSGRLSRAGRACAIAQFILVIAALVFLRVRNPTEVRYMPPCPTHAYLHVYCPGCGSLRAVHALLNGRVQSAWEYNPALVILGIPCGLWYVYALAMMSLLSRRPPLPRWVSARVAWALFGLLCAYFVIRNIPGEWSNWLRPPE